jgi:putative intracellular protease/amidase
MLIAQIVFDDFTDLDVFLCWDLLHRVRHPDWSVKLLGTAPTHTSRTGLPIPMHGTIEQAREADAVLFASGPSTRQLRFDHAYLRRFELAPERQLIGSMCSGALLLAALGLLEGKRATTHPVVVQLLRDAGVDVLEQPFVREGKLATAAACLAGVDLAAWVIESLLGGEARDAALAEVRPVGRELPERANIGSVVPQNQAPFGVAAHHRGSCLCGAIQYELGAELGAFGYCHCQSCRKASGSAHAANAPIDRANFRIVYGAELVRQIESTPGKFRAFCARCGSPLYAYLSSQPDVVRIRLGSLDTSFVERARAHTFTADAAPWHRIADDVPRFPSWAPRHVLHQRGSRQDEQP